MDGRVGVAHPKIIEGTNLDEKRSGVTFVKWRNIRGINRFLALIKNEKQDIFPLICYKTGCVSSNLRHAAILILFTVYSFLFVANSFHAPLLQMSLR